LGHSILARKIEDAGSPREWQDWLGTRSTDRSGSESIALAQAA
jgi:hypothetical protein